MSEPFRIRQATAADVDTIAWHRARMFQDMGEVPENLFEEFRAKARPRIEEMLNRGEYIGWLASSEKTPEMVIGGAGVQLHQILPRPISESDEVRIAAGRQAIIINVFTEPEWRRRGVAALLMRRIIEWSREENVDRLILHASDDGRALYQRLGFVASNEMRLAGELSQPSTINSQPSA